MTLKEQIIYDWAKYRGKCSTEDVQALNYAMQWTIERASEWLGKNAWRFMFCDEDSDDEYYYDDRKLIRAFKNSMQQ